MLDSSAFGSKVFVAAARAPCMVSCRCDLLCCDARISCLKAFWEFVFWEFVLFGDDVYVGRRGNGCG
jgi:hypothetical protein